MTLLVLGVILWSLVHFMPAGAAGLRGGIAGAIGEGPYKGLAALLLLGSVVLMVLGWRSTVPSDLYMPIEPSRHITMALMILSIFLLGAANAPSNVKRFIRHPMLTGVIVWSAAHLIANGDDRSLVLFGGIGLWALIMIPFLNKRDGAREKPGAVPVSKDAVLLVIAIVIYVGLVFAHPYFTGRSLM